MVDVALAVNTVAVVEGVRGVPLQPVVSRHHWYNMVVAGAVYLADAILDGSLLEDRINTCSWPEQEPFEN